MVEITINRPTCNIRFTGNPMTVAAELAAAISGIYQGLNSQEPMDAELFKGCVRRFMRDDSPTWNAPLEMVMVNVPQHKKRRYPYRPKLGYRICTKPAAWGCVAIIAHGSIFGKRK